MSIIQGHAKSSGSAGFYDYTLDQSARISKADSASIKMPYTSKGTATNLLKFTFSGWVKRGAVGDSTFHPIISAGTTATNDTIVFTNVDRLEYNLRTGGSIRSSHYTTAVFRDPSAWYHVVVAYDAANATAADRCKIYVNGVQQEITVNNAIETDRDTRFTNNASTADVYMGYGFRAGSAYYSDMYRAEFQMIDGQTLDPTYFAEEKSGIWVPKTYEGTYGNNGFHIDFSDTTVSAGSITSVNDSSPNGLNFNTVTNVEVSDIVSDSPTNNFCTLNSVEFVNNSGFLSEGNLKISDTSSANLSASGGTIGMKSGKWYWEAHLIVQENGFNIGVVKDTESATSGTWNYTKTNFYAINGLGTSYVSDGAGSQNAAGTTFAQGDTVQVAYDADTGKLYFGKNGTWLNSADPAAGTGNLETTSDPEYGYHPATSTIGDASGYSDVIMNFGQDSTFAGNLTAVGNTDANGIGDFKYTVPSGFLALCTSNLPDPAIDPAQDATPEDNFNTVLYTGNGSTQSITGVGHQPDFVWIKARVNRASRLYDSVRGVGNGLISNAVNAEAFDANGLTGFNADGFTVGSTDEVNYPANGFVAWTWKAGGTGVSNTDGSITSTVSANTDAGFSIVSYTGDGTVGTVTVGHGLSSAPDMVIVKNRDDGTAEWMIWTKDLSSGQNLEFDTDASASSSNRIDAADSTVVYLVGDNGNKVNKSGNDYIMYCFHSVDGFSKVGSYVANGLANGPFVYTGFRPKWVMTKESSATSNWHINDTERDSFNVCDFPLAADSSVGEPSSTAVEIDILSNGFKIRTTNSGRNASGNTYIYLAFAEQPMKYSNAR